MRHGSRDGGFAACWQGLLLPRAFREPSYPFLSHTCICEARTFSGENWTGGGLGLFLAPAGIVLFMFHLYRLTGNPLAFLQIQSQWGNSLSYPFASIYKFLKSPQYHQPLRVGTFRSFPFFSPLSVVPLLVWVWRRQKISDGIHFVLGTTIVRTRFANLHYFQSSTLARCVSLFSGVGNSRGKSARVPATLGFLCQPVGSVCCVVCQWISRCVCVSIAWLIFKQGFRTPRLLSTRYEGINTQARGKGMLLN